MKKLSLVSVLIFFFAVVVNAQSESSNHNIQVKIPSFSFVGVSDAGQGIVLEPKAPSIAGGALDFTASSASDDSKWLNYSSILKKGNGSKSNSISAALTGDVDLLSASGLEIVLTVSEDAGKGKGNTGAAVSSSPIVLDRTSKDVVTGIGNCYTGTGATSGRQLTYSLNLNDPDQYGKLISNDYYLTVTYTITEN
ncbi:hypothetical protein INQ51_17530 [Maribellus sp. CM-23]|uniref:hypothetical protein n=1 Tax=Maribellus sp. CM-23 TaxID=2781026 RepID=UPI001F1EF9E0|nr:hypothetical protein [Maribellus sp. CM-23]MCE4566125.1 hypothetical protein [Maribellus sp. CM-23]